MTVRKSLAKLHTMETGAGTGVIKAACDVVCGGVVVWSGVVVWGD